MVLKELIKVMFNAMTSNPYSEECLRSLEMATSEVGKSIYRVSLKIDVRFWFVREWLSVERVRTVD